MTDVFTKEQRSAVMRRVRGKDTGPEMLVRRLLTALGYRYRLHRADLPGRPDIVFPGRRKAIFVHGCFWHGHDCRAGRNRPASNASYWSVKLARTMARDERHGRELRQAGWTTLVLWECEILKHLDEVREKLLRFLD